MEKRVRISTSRSIGLLAVAAVWAFFLLLTGSPEAVLFTVPVFLLAAPLALGRYIGEETLAALRSRPVPRLANVPGLGLNESVEGLTGLFEVPLLPGRGPPAGTF